MAEGVPYAPEQILKLVKCGCVSERPCKGANCGCVGLVAMCSVPLVVVMPARMFLAQGTLMRQSSRAKTHLSGAEG